MAQLFPREANSLARSSLVIAAVGIGSLVAALYGLNRSGYNSGQSLIREQPVPFSHKHHVSGIGIDCRYCHTTVEKSSTAGIPPTETCMSCHSQIWSDAPMLEPIRESFRSGKSIQWTRVHDLPGFVYFNHSIHVAKGMGCAVCHGRVDQMPLMFQQNSLFMEWCLDCHRQPEKYIRPKDKVFDMAYKPAEDQMALGEKLVKEYKVRKLTDCWTCHR